MQILIKADMMKTFEKINFNLMHYSLGIEINKENQVSLCYRKDTPKTYSKNSKWSTANQ